jgi:hypothetical protein
LFVVFQDHHQYYNSSFISNNEMVGHQYWVNMTDRSDVQVNDMLSQSHRRAAVSEKNFSDLGAGGNEMLGHCVTDSMEPIPS